MKRFSSASGISLRRPTLKVRSFPEEINPKTVVRLTPMRFPASMIDIASGNFA